MVIFNELRITEDKSSLVVDCEVEGIDIYSGMHIDTIYVEYYKNALAIGVPSSKAIKIYDRDDDTEDRKAVRRCLNQTSLSVSDFGTDTFDKGLFYITVSCDGTLSADVVNYPCGTDNTVDIGVVLDWQRVYNQGMVYAAQLALGTRCSCTIPADFEQFVLFWNAFRLALSTCDYTQVAKLWDKFLKITGTGDSAISTGCGCGR